MSKAKYPVGTIMKHKSTGLICRISERSSYMVWFEVLKGDPTQHKMGYYNWHHHDEADTKFTLEYSPNSVNRLFEPLGPASAILYAKT